MFTIKEKEYIAGVVEATIRGLNNPEVDNANVDFVLLVQGKESWAHATIHPKWKTEGGK